MVRKNRRRLSLVPNAHSLVWFAKSAQKIRSLDCAQLSGAMGHALHLDEWSRWESSDIDGQSREAE